MKIRNYGKILCVLLLVSSICVISTTTVLALEPEEVDVTIRFYYLDYLYKDQDFWNGADVYLKILHQTGTSTSNTATDDYEDMGVFSLDNDDFDGDGLYTQQYENVDLDSGDLTWNIEVWDEDPGADDLLFEGLLTIKDPGSTGSHSSTDVNAYGHWIWYDSAWVPLHQEFSNSYIKFEWVDGPIYEGVTKTSNGLTLWISLYYT